MDIEGRNALVTGGGIRVGKAIALALGGAGANVFIHYNRSSAAASETASQLEDLGVHSAVGSYDLTDPEHASDLIAQATNAIGPISILVNNASGFATDHISDVTVDGWNRSHNLSLATPVFLTQAFAAALDGDTDGAVVNITDVRTSTPYETHFSYVVAKGGLDAFTKAAAVGLAPRIRVNAVALGVILPPPAEDEAYVQRLASQLPLQRPGGTGPVAAAALALIGNDFVTGEIVRLDGGGHLVSPHSVGTKDR